MDFFFGGGGALGISICLTTLKFLFLKITPMVAFSVSYIIYILFWKQNWYWSILLPHIWCLISYLLNIILSLNIWQVRAIVAISRYHHTNLFGLYSVLVLDHSLAKWTCFACFQFLSVITPVNEMQVSPLAKWTCFACFPFLYVINPVNEMQVSPLQNEQVNTGQVMFTGEIYYYWPLNSVDKSLVNHLFSLHNILRY